MHLPRHSGDKMCVKYSYTHRAVCANTHVFRKRPWCTLIGTCALNRMNIAIWVSFPLAPDISYICFQIRASEPINPIIRKEYHSLLRHTLIYQTRDSLNSELRHEKICFGVSDQVRHKPGCITTEYVFRLKFRI